MKAAVACPLLAEERVVDSGSTDMLLWIPFWPLMKLVAVRTCTMTPGVSCQVEELAVVEAP